MMKRSVGKSPVIDQVVKSAAKAGAVVFVVVLAFSALIGAGAEVFQLLMFAGVGVAVLIEGRPSWLLRSPVGRWLRR